MSSIIEKPTLTADTRVSSYDKLSGFLVASVAIIGFLTFLMFLIWLTLIVDWSSPSPPPPILELAGNDNRPEGIADDWQPPGVEEFPEVDTPQLADALEATTDAISTVRAQLEKVDGDAMEMGAGQGLGDSRARGPGSGNGNIIPESERWQIEMSASTQAEYMKILEFFGIELGVVHELSNLIQYVNNLTASNSPVRNGQRKGEGRLFFMNRSRRLRKWDENKAESSGIDLENTIVGHFYSPELREKLLLLEQAEYHPQGKTLEEVKRTYFEVKPSGSGYEYTVKDMEFRPKPKPRQ